MSTSIFTFDHGQKKLHNAIGISEEYLDDLSIKAKDVVVDYLFNEDRTIKDDSSPSQLVEACLTEFSYSQLVILASLHLQERIEVATTEMNEMTSKAIKSLRSITLDSKDMPEDIKKILDELTENNDGENPLDEDSVPKELSDFLKRLIQRQDGDGDND